MLLGMFVVPTLVVQAGTAVGRALGYDVDGPFAGFAVMIIAVMVQGIVLVGLTLRRTLGSGGLGLPPAALGLSARGLWREVRVGIVWGFIVFTANVGLSRLSQSVFRRILSEAQFRAQLDAEGAQFIDLVAAGLPAWLVVLFAFSSVVVAPLAEELFFRGYVHAVFRYRFPPHALFLSSALFAFVHFYLIHFIPVFAIGALLATLYERRGSLIAPVVAHACSNFIVTVTMVIGGLLQRGA